MPRPFCVPVIAVGVMVSAAALTGCTGPSPTTANPGQLDGATQTPTGPPPSGATSNRLPSCDAVRTAVDAVEMGVLDGLAYNETASTTNTAAEAYEQRVCVYTTADAVTELGITIAAIPFQQPEIDSYATLPNAIPDERLSGRDAVLQTFTTADGDDGHLDSSLYLIDAVYSITIQGITRGGDTTLTLPGLTVPAAINAAFATRDLVG